MYKLLLADDESDIREGLMEVVHFEEHGFTVVGQAENGLEALRLCEEQEPDLIVSDIRMPLMDGLTMLAEASTRDISKATKPDGFAENVKVAKRGGNVANVARQQLEAETGQPVITSQNAAQLNAVVTEMIEASAQAVDRQDDSKSK